MKKRAGREVAREVAKHCSGLFCVRKPPDIGQTRHRVDVNVLGGNEFEESQTAVRPAVTALLDAAPGSLRYGVGVNNLVDHDCPGVDPFG